MQKKLILIAGLLLVFLATCNNETPTEIIIEKATLDPNSAAGRGKALFSIHCAACHSIEVDVVIVGPSLAGISTVATSLVADLDAETYLSRSILYPDNFVVDGYESGTMQQNFASTLTSEEVDNLVAYLLTIQ